MYSNSQMRFTKQTINTFHERRTALALPLGWALITSLLLLLTLTYSGQAQSSCENPYVVQSGDTFSQIARKCAVAFDQLRASNPQIANIHRIEIGDRINLPGSPTTTNPPQPSVENRELENATVVLTGAATGNITLSNGSARRAVEGGILEVSIVGPTVAGDLNGDGADDVVTVTVERLQNSTGIFYGLHALVSGPNGLTDIGHLSLGDRITVNSINITNDGAIVVDMFAKGPNDPLAGASLHVIRTYRLHLGKLVLIQEKPGSGASPPPPVPNPPPPESGCSYPTRLQRGTKAHVGLNPPVANTVRNAPRRGAGELGTIQPGVVVELLDGPRCADGWQWWFVQAASGERGWTSEGRRGEYWLAPGLPTNRSASGSTPSVDAITFCRRVNGAQRCINPTTNFPRGLRRIEVNWNFQNLPLRTPVHHHWYHEGQRVHRRDNVVWASNRSATSGFAHTFYRPGSVFANGQWRLDFVHASDGQVLQSGYFTVGGPSVVAPDPSLWPAADFHGVWQTNFAEVTIRQTGNNVSGSYYRYSDSRVIAFSGTVANRVLRARTNGSRTPFMFTLNANGSAFDGEWVSSNGRSYPWCGVRNGPLPEGCGFSGVWQSTPAPYGRVELAQTGPFVSGRYYNGETWGSLSGEFDLRGPDASYSLAGVYQSDTDFATSRGHFRISLIDLDSKHFQGCWRNTVTQKVGNWCGWQGASGRGCPQVDRCE